jgi:hypothetical protein
MYYEGEEQGKTISREGMIELESQRRHLFATCRVRRDAGVIFVVIALSQKKKKKSSART